MVVHSLEGTAAGVGPDDNLEVIAVLGLDPFRSVDRLLSSVANAPMGTARAPRFMPMDLYRTEDHYVLTADLPGVDPGSVGLTVDRGTLTVTAERTAGEGDGVQWLASERPYGTYRRNILLGDGVDADGINATYQAGVLTVTIPVATSAQPRSIGIQVLDAPMDTVEESAGANELAAS